jgi:hypothetical protein
MVVTRRNEEAGVCASLPGEASLPANSVALTLRVADECETGWIVSRVILGYARR